MRNIGQMMKQAQEMQAKMEAMQSRLGELEVNGRSGAGMVEVIITAKGDLKKVKLDPKAVNPEDAEMLEDLIVAAFNDAKVKADEMVREETARAMGGLKLPPGMKLPF